MAGADAKKTALKDITEYCQEERLRLGISPADPMGPQNCLYFEEAIREYAGVESKPDFRKFNGGHNKKPPRIYVTFHTSDGKDIAVECGSEEQVDECICELMTRPGIKNIRVNRCGEFRNKKVVIIKFKEL